MKTIPKAFNPFIERLDQLFPILFPIGVVIFFSASFTLMSFYTAETPAEAIALGYAPMPAHWEAGVFNHGSYYRWLLPENHPVILGFSILFFFVGWGLTLVTGISKSVVRSKKISVSDKR